ncbi:MAG: M48 family metalloprotease [Mariprofundales bacterium]
MKFLKHKKAAQRNTRRLIVLFAIGVAILVALTYIFITILGPFFALGLVFTSALFSMDVNNFSANNILISLDAFGHPIFWNWPRFIFVVLAVGCIIGAGSMYKLNKLHQQGGRGIARLLNGQLLRRNSTDVLELRLRNVVEELAIVTGIPAPTIYIIPTIGINAFAAGFGRGKAIIGVSNDCLILLNREQLQAVLAHEFSHIIQGDMQLNMRMLGLLYGITLISEIGMMLAVGTHTRTPMYEKKHNPSNVRYAIPQLAIINFFIAILGFLMIFAGIIGIIISDLIKRGISRQREFMADASAVEITRNPRALASALKVVGGFEESTPTPKYSAATHSQLSHFFFHHQVSMDFSGHWYNTHPPLAERIRRLEPSFHGTFPKVVLATIEADNMRMAFAEISGNIPIKSNSQNSTPVQNAGYILSTIPTRIKKVLHDPVSAAPLVYALLLDSEKTVRNQQLKWLQKHEYNSDMPVGTVQQLLAIYPIIRSCNANLRLPMLDLVLPALQLMDAKQYKIFRYAVKNMMEADNKISLFEYCLHLLLVHHLDDSFGKGWDVVRSQYPLSVMLPACRVILAMMAHHGAKEEGFIYGMMIMKNEITECALSEADRTLPTCPSIAKLDRSLKKIARVQEPLRLRLLEACAACVKSDGIVATSEGELLRVIADSLDCPVPPIEL